ncbi:MAG: (deoxy)nucleoside triphosphate pyrophosphohydrolase [Desulfuromonas sp.]|nr:MAG: (deoxy)nucleoside triphosphate pyrophosphohydrolase [Desulfuromonas sp.]
MSHENSFPLVGMSIMWIHQKGEYMAHPLIVTAAVIRKEGQILLTRRPAGKRDAGKWEFPGGKLGPNESPEDGLQRELLEELNLPARIGKIYQVVHHIYDWGAVLLLFYDCHPLSDKIENRDVAEHRFVLLDKLAEYDILEADWPVINQLIADKHS